MSGQTLRFNTKRQGFTLVELLIVIVVIAILAAISVVAYNGVVQRAQVSQVLATVNSYVKAFNVYKAENGVYPTVATCLGPQSNYPGNSCPVAPYWYSPANYDPATNTALAQAVPGVLQLGVWGGSPTGVIWYHNNYFGNNIAVLGYELPAGNKCQEGPVLVSPWTATSISTTGYTGGDGPNWACVILLGPIQ